MNSRTWIAVILSCAVWFVYMEMFPPTVPPAPNKPGAEKKLTTTSTAIAPADPSMVPQAVTTGKTILPTGFLPSEQIHVETKDLDVSFSKEGGKISRIYTLSHKKSLEPGAPPMTVIDAEDNPWSLGTVFTAVELNPLSSGAYALKKNENGIVVFEHAIPGAIGIYKEYAVSDGHVLGWTLKLKRLSPQRRDWGYLYIPLGQMKSEHVSDNPLKAWEVVAYQDETVTRTTADKLSAPVWKQGITGWLAFGNRYFVSALVPAGALNPDVGTFADPSWSGAALRYPVVFNDSDEIVLNLKVFAGPKDYGLLRQIKGLGSVIDYGMFSFFAFPLLELLRFFYRFVGNYGLAIILLTLLVRILFYPLSLKGYQSMKAMQKLQPQIQALKEKYKDDTAKFGQEQMALFKAHKVNPAGGCLPMLVQLPVFIALYSVLNSSVELFHAPFFGWISDLSAKDPFYIFPVLMGISMFVQQKMTPAAGMDPAQQKILLLMPIVFSFIMLNLPSGLTVYIFLSTVLGILQQVMINRGAEKNPSSPAPRPAS